MPSLIRSLLMHSASKPQHGISVPSRFESLHCHRKSLPCLRIASQRCAFAPLVWAFPLRCCLLSALAMTCAAFLATQCRHRSVRDVLSVPSLRNSKHISAVPLRSKTSLCHRTANLYLAVAKPCQSMPSQSTSRLCPSRAAYAMPLRYSATLCPSGTEPSPSRRSVRALGCVPPRG